MSPTAPHAVRRVQAVLLDLDDTLFDERGTARRAFSQWQGALGLDGTEPPADAFTRWQATTVRHWQRYADGEIGFLDQRRERLREFTGRPLPDSEADAMFEPYRLAYEANWSIVRDAAEFLQRCGHLPKVIVSNGPLPMQRRKLQAFGLDDHFIGFSTPDVCGHAKPRHEIFHHAMAQLRLPAAACLMIGDDWRCDIEPAAALGMATFHVRPEAGNLLDALALL
ncbi:HAD family hydrolase [Ideonella sp. DXS29W]|uniref:HAD family hydrolase n=1 Tax=Ideonella lacteola TaxID=2984193 RepID=A0ABU9BP89_9BURK